MKSMIENTSIPIPATADDLNRNPSKYTDPVIAEQSRTPVNTNDVEKSLRMFLGLK